MESEAGICGDLFGDYLSNRLQVVSINSKYSGEIVIKFGIPQGTVLGPILFQLYINDLLKLDIPGQIVSYADDTALIFSDTSWEGVKNKAEMGLYKVTKWLNQNKLTLNKTKTKFITFSLNVLGKSDIQKLQLHQCKDLKNCNSCRSHIETTNSIKYLGIVIDKFLNWEKHTQLLINKMRRLIYKFYQLRQCMGTKLLVNVYKALIESILNYGVVIWGGAYDSTLYHIKIIQKQIIKIIFNKSKFYSTEALFRETSLFDFDCLYIIASLNFIQKNTKISNKILHDYSTRSKMNKNYTIPKPNKTVFLKFIDYNGIKLYNLLPKEIKDIKNMKIYKKKIKIYVREHIDLFK